MPKIARKSAAAPTIQTPKGRAALKASNPSRTTPHWHRVEPKHFVGWRASSDTWVAKVEAKGEQRTCPLGALDDVAEDQRFASAQRLAAEWFTQLDAEGKGVQVLGSRVTMRQALREYRASCAAERPAHKADPAAWAEDKAKRTTAIFDFCVTPFRLKGQEPGESWIDTPLGKLKPADFRAWREWLAALPVAERSRKGGEERARTGASVNRTIVPLRAALNLARKSHKGPHGVVVIPDSWSEELARDLDADKSRGNTAFVPADDRERLLAAAQEVAPAVVPFLLAHLIAPIRPGAWAALRVRDYDARTHTVYVADDKAGHGRRVPMPTDAECKKLFAQAIKGKTPAAFLFTDDNGNGWKADKWNDAIKAAATHAGTDPEVGFYWLRHTRITDLIMKGTPVQAVAKLAGTSAAQIEKTYFHLLDDAARQALAGYR